MISYKIKHFIQHLHIICMFNFHNNKLPCTRCCFRCLWSVYYDQTLLDYNTRILRFVWTTRTFILLGSNKITPIGTFIWVQILMQLGWSDVLDLTHTWSLYIYPGNIIPSHKFSINHADLWSFWSIRSLKICSYLVSSASNYLCQVLFWLPVYWMLMWPMNKPYHVRKV